MPHEHPASPAARADDRYGAARARPRGRAVGWAVLLTVGLWAGGLILAYLLASDAVPPGRCEGLGFGCTLSPRGTVGLLAVLTAAPVLAATAVAVPVAAWLAGRLRSGLAAGAAAAGCCWTVGLVVAGVAYAL